MPFFISVTGITVSKKKKRIKHLTQNFELFLHLRLKFEIIWTRILIKLLDNEIKAIFLKDPVFRYDNFFQK